MTVRKLLGHRFFRAVAKKMGHGRLCLAEFAACLGGMSYGLSVGYSSPALPDIRSRLHITDDQGDWFAALLNVGALIGGLVAGMVPAFYISKEVKNKNNPTHRVTRLQNQMCD